jgi:hypothetical protein
MLVALVGCAAPEVTPVAFAAPQALVTCANVPALQARLWLSGSAAPCALDVDDEGNASGACEAAPGVVRTATLDWFLPAGEIDLVLAQVRSSVDLADTTKGETELTFAADDITATACRDMRVDQVEGAASIVVDGVDVPVCDVDNSCGDTPADACANLGEVCAGSDPLDAGSEPP